MDTARRQQFKDELILQLILILVSGLLMVVALWWIHLPTWKRMQLLMKLERAAHNSPDQVKELTGRQAAELAAFVRSVHDWEREQRLKYAKRRSSPPGDSSSQSD